jgi:hypothetical protein
MDLLITMSESATGRYLAIVRSAENVGYDRTLFAMSENMQASGAGDSEAEAVRNAVNQLYPEEG